MISQNTLIAGALLMLFSLAGFACNRNSQSSDAESFPSPQLDDELTSATQDVARGQEDVIMSTPADTNVEETYKEVVLAGGCFWCVEAVYERVDGVIDVESGYAGGAADTANYKAVSTGKTGHAEVVRITYDPSKVTYGDILKLFFSVAHDPTTLNRQGADVGTQYRSAIFYKNPEQKEIAEAYIQQLTEAEVFEDPIVTTLEPLEEFFVAETYHQDFATNNPDHGYIRAVSDPKVKKLEEKHAEMLRQDEAPVE